MNNRFLLVLLTIVVVLGGLFYFTRDKQEAPDTQASVSSHTYGKADSKVVLIEYGDFECPACAAYFPIVSRIKEDYKDRISFQFRHFPLVQIHANAMIASRAAEAAGKQNKFWEMHDLLYTNQDNWAKSQNASTIFEDYATQLGLNVDQFKSDVAAQSTVDTINADVREGQKLNIDSTPSFVLNGQKLENLQPSYEGLSKAIDEALKTNQ